MEELIDNVPSKLLTLSAVAVGIFLISDLNVNEQNAIGNWLMLVSQVLCTNAYFDQIRESYEKSMKDREFNFSDVDLLKKIRDAIDKEINIIEKDSGK